MHYNSLHIGISTGERSLVSVNVAHENDFELVVMNRPILIYIYSAVCIHFYYSTKSRRTNFFNLRSPQKLTLATHHVVGNDNWTQDNNTMICIFKLPHSIFCGDQEFIEPEEPLGYHDLKFWLFVVAYIAVVVFAGLMSGLTLAIFSLDLTSLRVLEVAGSERDKRYASKIMPLAQRQYLVLVSLVLANALSVETMPLIIDRISTPLIAILVSVTAVLIFGEVIPQAVCGRYGLIIGYLFSWLVWVIIGVEFVVAYPLSKLLEYLLGKNYGTYYRRAELKALVDFHGPGKLASKMPANKTPVAIEEARAIGDEQLTIDEVLIIKGALELTTKRALSAMVKLEDVFMISVHDNIDKKLLLEILEVGHSRIPVCGKTKADVLGVFLTKRLILVDPNQVTPVKELTQDKRYFYPVFWIDGDMPLYILLNKFQEGASTHMAFVREKKPDGTYVPSGVVTLEDVLEEILQEEIYDEIDAFRGVAKRIQLARAHALRAISSSGSHGKISAANNNRTTRKISKDNRPPNPKVPRLVGAPPTSQEGSGQSSVTESRRTPSPRSSTIKKAKNAVKPHHRHHQKNPKTQDVHANVNSIAPKTP